MREFQQRVEQRLTRLRGEALKAREHQYDGVALLCIVLQAHEQGFDHFIWRRAPRLYGFLGGLVNMANCTHVLRHLLRAHRVA